MRAGIQNEIAEPKYSIIARNSRQIAPQNGKIDGREELDDVTSQDIAIAPGKKSTAIQCLMDALAAPVGIGIGNEAALIERFQNIHQRMMHHPIRKRRGGNDPWLGIGDGEAAIAART